MITQKDIFELKSLAKNYLLAYPSRARLKGTDRDITFEDFRVLAIYEATITLLNKRGYFASDLGERSKELESLKLDFEPVEGSDPY